MIRCWFCPEDTPGPAAELLLAAVPERPGTAVLRHVCPSCLAANRLRPAADVPGGGLAAVLAAASAVLLVALVAVRR